jgi:ubiquitin carboxyl-terminal hydrolase 25/28
MSSFMGPELPPLYPPPDHAPPPVPARPPPILEETPEDVDMVGSGDYHEGHTRDTSSEATLVDVNELQDDTDMANKPPASDPSATVAAPLTSSPKPIDEDTVMVNGAIALMSPPATPERGPPVPPRGRPTDINTTTTADDEMSRQERLTFGAQQDVTEVIGNVMFRLQCAIKPTAIDPKYGEQTDIIRETFYGSNAMYLKKDNKYDIKVEDWANIIVFPSSEGPRDVYEALDVVFDEQVVEIDKTTTTQFASIKTLPPIVQIQIQRTAFDPVTQTASKNTNPIKFEETLYLDRYMDDDKVLARRQSAWQWKSRLRDLEARKKAIENTKANVPLLAVLQATKNYIHELEAQDAVVDISPNLSGMLEDRGATIQRELQGINVEIAKLKQKLQDQFTDLRQHRYRLQAVFIHRGTNQAGHYWIYIYDFARDVWREYNDERVFIVDDRKRIFEQQGGATPYYLVYVRDDIKEDLVEAVHRDLAPSPTVKPVKDTEMLDVERVVEVGNGVQHVEHAEHVEYAEHVENADKHSQTLRRSTQEISAMKLGSASPERPGEERKGG